MNHDDDSDPPASEPLLVSASLEGDDLELVLTYEGMLALQELRDDMRRTNPHADYKDVLKAAMRSLIEELESMN